MYTGPFGYDEAAPPILDGTADDPPSPYCHLGPCIISKGPSWLVGSSAPSLGNLAKRYELNRKFWRVLRQLGVWSHPLYLNEKLTQLLLMSGKYCKFFFVLFLLTPVISYVLVLECQKKIPEPARSNKYFEPSSFIA